MPPRLIRGTRLSWSTIPEWIALCEREAAKSRCSTPAHDRLDRLYRSLTIFDIRSSFDRAGLHLLERRLYRSRHLGAWPNSLHELWRVMSRADIGEMLAETRNRIVALQNGRAYSPRRAGPRFDPVMIPDAAIDRLIQQHPDLAVVELLRAEKRRRAGLEAPDRGI